MKEEGWGFVFERSSNPMLILSDDRSVLDANPAACLYFGLARVILLEKCFDDLFPESIEPEENWNLFLETYTWQGEVGEIAGERHLSSKRQYWRK